MARATKHTNGHLLLIEFVILPLDAHYIYELCLVKTLLRKNPMEKNPSEKKRVHISYILTKIKFTPPRGHII